MSRAGSSSDSSDAGVCQSITGERPGYKNPPLCLIICRHGPPLPDVIYAEAGNNEKDSDSSGDDRKRQKGKTKDPL